MSTFLGPDFLLGNATAQRLFHEVATACPIVDVHNHLVPDDIAGDRVWPTLTELWLDDDHYKWRAMRAAGTPEHLVTGAADPWEKFLAWARAIPRSIRNPLYVWTHLELRRVFGIDLVLNEHTANEIWTEANRQLPRWSARTLLRHFDVNAVATTDSPADPLTTHQRLADEQRYGSEFRTAMLPTFRPDAAHRLLFDPAAWNEWIDRFGGEVGHRIDDLDSLLVALTTTYARFDALGCRASDHGLGRLPDMDRDRAAADAAIRFARAGGVPSQYQIDAVLLEVVSAAARFAFEHDAVLQLHLGPLRNVSPRLMSAYGADAGADVMGDERQAPGLARFLGNLEAAGTLPRTVLYNLNPADNALMATMAGAFAREGVASLVQWGPPWWFNDHEDGMRRQLDDLSAIGQLGGFIGMLTDSRAILSMTRHELFRRVLCDALGRDVDAGRIPNDPDLLDGLVRDVCVRNAVDFFGFPKAWAVSSR